MWRKGIKWRKKYKMDNEDIMDYQDIGKEDTETIIKLTNRFLTQGEEIGKEIRDSIVSGNYFGVKAVKADEIIGFMTYKEGMEFTLPKPELLTEITKLYDSRKIFTGDGLYVSSDYRNRGVAGRLIKLAREEIVKMGGELVLTELWVYPDGSFPAGDVINNYGKKVYERFVPFFYQDLKCYGMQCPICKGECRCSAVIRLYDAVRYNGTEKSKDAEREQYAGQENYHNADSVDRNYGCFTDWSELRGISPDVSKILL